VGSSVSWRVVSASAAGTSHIEAGTACEDSGSAQVHVWPDSGPLLSMFVADGAGSARHGGEGAHAAVETAVAFVDAAGFPELNEQLGRKCVKAVRAAIRSRAKAEGATARDFACTFLGVLSSGTATLVMQVGDGGCVLDVGAGLEIPVLPMSGEYANMTHFVTDENALDVLAIKTYAGPASRAALFSDGLQRLAIDLTTHLPHAPLFERLFGALSSAGDGRDDELHEALMRFLTSPSVNERTDDDKTLALAIIVP
jgi:hypothetical protein